jgi:hypothetical protein
MSGARRCAFFGACFCEAWGGEHFFGCCCEGHGTSAESHTTLPLSQHIHSPNTRPSHLLLLRQAALIDPSKDAYDVLLDDYEKGMTAARLDEIFAEVG